MLVCPLQHLPGEDCFFFCFVLQDRFLCVAGCPGTHFADWAGLELTKVHLPLPLSCWDRRHGLPLYSKIAFFSFPLPGSSVAFIFLLSGNPHYRARIILTFQLHRVLKNAIVIYEKCMAFTYEKSNNNCFYLLTNKF